MRKKSHKNENGKHENRHDGLRPNPTISMLNKKKIYEWLTLTGHSQVVARSVGN